MKPIAAIVESESERDTAEVRELYASLRLVESEERGIIERADRQRLHLGRRLGEIRKRWPLHGPKSKPWGDFCAVVGIEQSTAWRYMKLAGYVDGVSCTVQETPDRPPTYAAAGLDNRPGPEGDDEDESDEDDIDRDTWCTPKWLTDAIGHFELDPCANERSHVRSEYSYRLDRGEDGLKLGPSVTGDNRVFINPPYSDVMPWVKAYRHARFAFLLKFDPSTRWFAELIKHTGLILAPRGTRIQFEPPPGVPPRKAKANQFPHALFYAREEDATAEIRALCFAWRVEHETTNT